MISPAPPISIPLALGMSERFVEGFDSPLSLRSGGDGDQALFRGQGLFTPRLFYRPLSFFSDPHGTAGTADALVGALNVDPGQVSGYSPFAVADSMLTITTQRRPALLDSQLPVNPDTGQIYDWVTGLLTTRHALYFKPAPGAGVYVETRACLNYGRGYWGGVNLIYGQETGSAYYFEPPFEPVVPWGADKPQIEIDGAEYQPADIDAFHLNFGIHCKRTLADPDYTSNITQNTLLPFRPSEGFHDYGMLWETDKFVYYVDNVEYYRVTLPTDWTTSFGYLVLGGATVGNASGGTNAPGATWPPPPPDDGPQTGSTIIDHVKVFGFPGTPIRIRLDGSAPF